MSQLGRWVSSTAAVEDLIGNDGITVAPIAGDLWVVGTGIISTSGNVATGTITIAISGIGNHSLCVGNALGSINSLAVGLTGQGLMGVTGADPSWTGSPSFSGLVTAGTGLTATTGNITCMTGSIATLAGSFAVGATTADAFASLVEFKKSRTGAIITSGDALGSILFDGYDGANYHVSSQITSTSSGTIGAGRVASDLKFYTHPDAVGVATQRMTIASTGCVTIAAPDSGTALTITDGGLTVTSGTTTLTALSAARAGIVRASTTGVVSALIDSNTDGQVLISSSVGVPAWASITPGAGISVTPGVNTITIANTSGVMPWTEITGATLAIAVSNGYIMNRATLITATLPATALLGDIFQLAGHGSGGWLIAQNALQSIHFGNVTTTIGVGGSLASSNAYDGIKLICITAGASTEWSVIYALGNLTVV